MSRAWLGGGFLLLIFVGVGLWSLTSSPQLSQTPSPSPAHEPGRQQALKRPVKTKQARATKALVKRGGLKALEPKPGELGGGPRVWTREEIDKDRAVRMEQQQQGRRRNTDRYRHASAIFEKEKRDEPWATERESLLRAEADRGGVQNMLVDAKCRSTMCQLTWEVVDTHSFFRVRSSPAMGELSADTASTTEGRPAERLWIVLGAREGHSLEAGMPATAPAPAKAPAAKPAPRAPSPAPK